jgi:integral membrane sensor domain MASE1
LKLELFLLFLPFLILFRLPCPDPHQSPPKNMVEIVKVPAALELKATLALSHLVPWSFVRMLSTSK